MVTHTSIRAMKINSDKLSPLKMDLAQVAISFKYSFTLSPPRSTASTIATACYLAIPIVLWLIRAFTGVYSSASCAVAARLLRHCQYLRFSIWQQTAKILLSAFFDSVRNFPIALTLRVAVDVNNDRDHIAHAYIERLRYCHAVVAVLR